VLVRLCPELPAVAPVMADPGTMQVLLRPGLPRWEAVAYISALMPDVDPIVIEAAIIDCETFERLAESTGLDAELAAAADGTVPLQRRPVALPSAEPAPAARTALLDRPPVPVRLAPLGSPDAPGRKGPRSRAHPAFALVLAAVGVLVVLVSTGTAPLAIRTAPDRSGADAEPSGQRAKGGTGGADAAQDGRTGRSAGVTPGRAVPAVPGGVTPPAGVTPAARRPGPVGSPQSGATSTPAGTAAPGEPVSSDAAEEPEPTPEVTSDPPAAEVTPEPSTEAPTDPSAVSEPPDSCTVEAGSVGLICPAG
jgi:hypothetical protein